VHVIQLSRFWSGWRERGAVVADDLPAGGCVFDHEEEIAVRVASTSGGALEVEVTGHSGKIGVEWLGFELGEAEDAHFFRRIVTGFVGGKHLVVAAADFSAYEENIRRIFVAFGEGVDIVAVPIVDGFLHHGADG